MHFRISSSLSFQRKTKRHVFLLLFVLTPVHLNWPSHAPWKCYRLPRQLISTMKHWWFYITINFLTIFKWKTRNSRLNLIYLSFFVQFMYYLCSRATWWSTIVRKICGNHNFTRMGPGTNYLQIKYQLATLTRSSFQGILMDSLMSHFWPPREFFIKANDLSNFLIWNIFKYKKFRRLLENAALPVTFLHVLYPFYTWISQCINQ